MSGLETRAPRNVVIVATANKLARISWAVLASGNDYHPGHKALAFSNTDGHRALQFGVLMAPTDSR